MMRKYWYIAWMICSFLLLAFVSCSDDDDDDYLPVDEAWKAANIEAFDKRQYDDGISYINSESGNGKILYKVIKKGEGTETIYYNSVVKCYYKGCFIADEDGNYIANRDSILSQGQVFDSRLEEDDDDPIEATVGTGLIDGWATALQHMHVGDEWEVWVPYSLGYGVSGSSSGTVTINPYTTLVFKVKVASIVTQ